MRSIALALGASLTWGVADFFGPLKGRVLGALRVLVYVQIGGLVVIALIVAIRGKGPAGSEALLAIPAAISGTLGLFAYYQGMAVGAMSIVAPIAGISAAVPVVFGIATGDRPSLWQWLGIGAALGGVFLASRDPGHGGRVAAGVGLALLAAIGFGGYFPAMHAAGNADYWWASLIFRTTSTSRHSRGGRDPAAVACDPADPDPNFGARSGPATCSATSSSRRRPRAAWSASRPCWRRSIRSSRSSWPASYSRSASRARKRRESR